MAKVSTLALSAIDEEEYRRTAKDFEEGLLTFRVSSKKYIEARALETEEEYTVCVQLANQAGDKVAEIEKSFEPACKALFAAHRAMTKLREDSKSKWSKLQDMLLVRAKAWHLEQKKAKAIAETQMAGIVQKHQVSLIAEADDLMSMGDVRGAEKLLSQSRMVTAPILPEAVPKVEGARVTDKWAASCTDLMAVIKAIAAGEVPLMHSFRGEDRPLLTVDQAVLNAIVSRQGQGFNCPGVQIVPDVSIGRGK